MFIGDIDGSNFYDVDIIVRLCKTQRAVDGNYDVKGYTKCGQSFAIVLDVPEEQADKLIQSIGLSKDKRYEIEGYVLNP